MKKPHCDNCDAVIVDAIPMRRLTVNPGGYQCVVNITVSKETPQELCAACLFETAMEFARSIPERARVR